MTLTSGLALALFLPGCGADPREEAPPLATAAAIAQAPPNAIGADVDRPSAPPISTKTKSTEPVPLPRNGKPNPQIQPMDPLAPDDPVPPKTPQKGTDL